MLVDSRLLNLLANNQFWQSSIVHGLYTWDFPNFLLALPSNNQFIIKLVKMWPGGTPHVVVGTLKISLDQLKKKKKTQEEV